MIKIPLSLTLAGNVQKFTIPTWNIGTEYKDSFHNVHKGALQFQQSQLIDFTFSVRQLSEGMET